MSNHMNGKYSFSEDLINLIKKRRSVRIFNGEKIPSDLIAKIIEAGVWAPTGCNNQELRFLILEKEGELKGILRFKPFFKDASHFILVFCDMSLSMSRRIYVKNKHERNLPHVDTGLALMNMVLFAKSIGIDSCIFNLSEYHFGQFERRTIVNRISSKLKSKIGLHKLAENNFEFFLRKKLKIPKHLKIMAGLALGYVKIYPDINKEIHGGRKIMRNDLANYILKKE